MKKLITLLLACAMLVAMIPMALIPVSADEAEAEEAVWENPYYDVDYDDWYYNSVAFTNQNSLFTGTSAHTFSPDMTMTRAMMVTVLYRLAGLPQKFSYYMPYSFRDVAVGNYYYAAVNWAAYTGVTKGTGEYCFSPDLAVTRQDIAVYLYRYAKNNSYDTEVKGELDRFGDTDLISGYAEDAMTWAVGANIIRGFDDNLNPTGNATRAEVATMLMRFVSLYVKD